MWKQAIMRNAGPRLRPRGSDDLLARACLTERHRRCLMPVLAVAGFIQAQTPRFQQVDITNYWNLQAAAGRASLSPSEWKLNRRAKGGLPPAAQGNEPQGRPVNQWNKFLLNTAEGVHAEPKLRQHSCKCAVRAPLTFKMQADGNPCNAEIT